MCRVIPDGTSNWLVAHPSCSWGRRAGSSCQRELQLLCWMGMGAWGRKHLPSSSSLSSAAALSVPWIVFQWERYPAVLAGESPIWEGESGKGRKSPVGPSFREAHFGCGQDLEPSRCQISIQLLRRALPCPVLALPLLHSRRSPVVPFGRQLEMQDERSIVAVHETKAHPATVHPAEE